MKPALSYYGGKQNIADKIIELMPAHDVYCEPFCGGAAVFFKKQPARVNVLNDLNGKIINFYRVLQDKDKGAELIRRLEATPYSRAEHDLSSNWYRGNIEARDDIDAARLLYVTIMQGFLKKAASGWGYSIRGSNKPSGFQTNVSRLSQCSQLLKDVYVECNDAVKVINAWDSKKTLFYVDPPYPETDQGHYKGYTNEMFSELLLLLDKIEGSFILSCYDKEWMKIPEGWEKHQIKTRMTTSRNKNVDAKRIETLFYNLNNHAGMQGELC